MPGCSQGVQLGDRPKAIPLCSPGTAEASRGCRAGCRLLVGCVVYPAAKRDRQADNPVVVGRERLVVTARVRVVVAWRETDVVVGRRVALVVCRETGVVTVRHAGVVMCRGVVVVSRSPW